MIQHIMLWNYHEEVTGEEREAIQAWLERLPTLVPALQSVQWGAVFGGRNQSFSHCFVMLFRDRDDLSLYATHPEHVKFAVAFKRLCAVQVVADFEAQNSDE